MRGPIFTYEEPGASGDNLAAAHKGNGITITIEEPWAGSTETGFGYRCSVRLDCAAARDLGEWLIHWAGETPTD